jgi:transmembrane protein TMEM220
MSSHSEGLIFAHRRATDRASLPTVTGHFWTLANGIMLLMFVFSAVVQVNDPDPVAWMGIYGAAATVCGLEIRRRAPAWAPVALAFIALVWAGSIHSRAHDVPIKALFAEWGMRELRIEEAHAHR